MSTFCLKKLVFFQIFLVSMSQTDRIENFLKLWKEFLLDRQLEFASISMTILDDQTGSILFQHQNNIGLPPASSMKTITAAAAIHYLGEEFSYSTTLKYSGTIDHQTGFLDGFIYLVGSGDPSLGSDRFDDSTKGDFLIEKWTKIIVEAGIRRCRGIIGDPTIWGTTKQIQIDGWTWNDLGQYYGTGHSGLNWRENEFQIEIQPGENIGEKATIKPIRNPPPNLQLINEIETISTGDEDISMYFSLDGSNESFLRGKIHLNTSKDFSIRCSVPNSALYIADELTRSLKNNGIQIEQNAQTGQCPKENLTILDVHRSPPLSKLIEPFLRISINMYGEVFVKTIAFETGLSSLSDAPQQILRLYVKNLFDEQNENLVSAVSTTDGSGLSRSNRLTTLALAKILFSVQKQIWFQPVFFNAFPTINGIRMKSGTLTNTIAYAGYIRENHFIFSFMINNFYGKTAQQMREKIWSVLDALK